MSKEVPVPPIGDEPSKGTDAGPDKQIPDPDSNEAVVDRESIGAAKDIYPDEGDGPNSEGGGSSEDEAEPKEGEEEEPV